MSTKIANLAARHLGGEEISNLETERSELARAARAFFDIARDETLRDCNLPHSRRRIELALAGEDTSGNVLRYKYRYPADCLAVRGIYNPTYIPLDGLNVYGLYEIGNDEEGTCIYSSIPNLEVRYTYRVKSIDAYPSDFTMALSYRLACYMAPSVTKGDPFKRGDYCAQMYEISVDKCKANAYNEEPSVPAMNTELAGYGLLDLGGYPISGRKDLP